MAEITTVLIRYGNLEVGLELSYRWYVEGKDPWKLVNGNMHIVPMKGMWWYRPLFEGHKHRFLDDSKGNISMKLRHFDRKKVGDWGWGEFLNQGGMNYMIPQFAKFYWEILGFD
jgi:hypothetical protein